MHGCHSFCNTWVNTAPKMIMMKKLSRKSFIEAATCTAAKGREESFKRWGKRRIHGIFLLSSRLQHRVLVHFFQVPLTWQNPLKLNTFFCSLQWVEKVTAQMIPSSSPFKFWHGSLFVTTDKYSVHALAHAPFGLFHFRWKVEMRKWLVNNTSVYFFSSPGLLEHDFMKKTAREKRWSARVSRLKCTRSPRPVDRGRPQCPVSYPDNNSAKSICTVHSAAETRPGRHVHIIAPWAVGQGAPQAINRCVKERRKIELTVWGKKMPIADRRDSNLYLWDTRP